MSDDYETTPRRDRDQRGIQPQPAERSDRHDHGREVARRMVASRSVDAAGPASLLHLQRAAGNAGVGSLVGGEGEADDGAHSQVLDVVGKGGGAPLPTDVRSEMEAGLGSDFGSVRVHDGPAAAESARSVQAQAYTVGDEIVFNRGAYQPSTEQGRHTLAHELTHVVQQRSGPVDGTPTGDGVAVSHPDDRFERAAEANASAFSSGTLGVQRAAGEEEIEETDELQSMPLQREGETDEELPEEEPMEEPA